MDRAAETSFSMRNTSARYGIVAQTLHWLIVILVLLQFLLGIKAHGLPVSLERLMLLARHKSIGITIFVLMLLRLAWRLYSPPPPLPVGDSPILNVAARVSHGLLYTLLLLMPLVGWLLSSASNLSVSWFGLVSLPNLVAPNHHLAHWLLLTHQSMAWLLLALVIGHTGAALWHHLILKDNVLLRMLPFNDPDKNHGDPQ
ncbi:MAG: cytochrome b [Gammaproteobacteria bacterium]